MGEVSLLVEANQTIVLSQAFDKLQLAALEDTLLRFNPSWNVPAGTYEVQVKIDSVNGQKDQNSGNDVSQQSLYVAQQLAPGLALVEHFTQTNCFTCAEQNPSFFNLMERESEKVALISYHAPFPGQNNDPMHLFNAQEQLDRLAFYGVAAVPKALVQGGFVQDGAFSGAPNGVNVEDIDQAVAQKSVVELDIRAIFGKDRLEGEVIVMPLLFPPAVDWRIFTVVVQEQISFSTAPGSNGEKEFQSVFRRFLTSSEGENLSLTQPGDSVRLPFQYSIPSNIQNQDLKIISWVQDKDSKEVVAVNTSRIPLPTQTSIPAIIKLYQRGDRWYIENPQWNNRAVTFRLFDVMGHLVWEKKQLFGGNEVELFHVADFEKGLYVVTFSSSNSHEGRKIILR